MLSYWMLWIKLIIRYCVSCWITYILQNDTRYIKYQIQFFVFYGIPFTIDIIEALTITVSSKAFEVKIHKMLNTKSNVGVYRFGCGTSTLTPSLCVNQVCWITLVKLSYWSLRCGLDLEIYCDRSVLGYVRGLDSILPVWRLEGAKLWSLWMY